MRSDGNNIVAKHSINNITRIELFKSMCILKAYETIPLYFSKKF